MNDKVGRNAKCHCGSGRKYKHCCLAKKARLKSLDIHLPEGSRPGGMVVNRDGIAVVDVNGLLIKSEAYIETYYEKIGKNKILHKFRVDQASTNIDIHKELLRYDNFVCIDTNTKEIPNQGALSVSAVVLGFYHKRSDAGGELNLSLSCGFEFRGLGPTLAERHGLRLLLTAMQGDPKFNGKTGVIIDHDQSRIPRLNSRQEPIVDDFYLPKGNELIYATADSGTEYAPNRMIKDADLFARDIMNEILESEETRYGRHIGLDTYGVPFAQWLVRPA